MLVFAERSSGSLNYSASTITKFIHTISECTFRIASEYQNDFFINSIVLASEKPTYNTVWSGYDGYTYLENLNVYEYTVPSGKWLQICIRNKDITPFTSDLLICNEILRYDGELELVR